MALPPPRRRNHRRLVVVALASGVVAVLVLVVVVASTLVRGERPEETVADEFLAAVFAGDGATAYRLTTPSYRAVVFEGELGRIADELLEVVGPDTSIEILGSERTVPTPVPPESLVGYQAATAIGTVEGVVTLFELAPGEWSVLGVSHRFPDADPEQVKTIRELLRSLNEQVGSRLDCQVDPAATSC